MGIDPVHIINHKLAYKEPNEFLRKLKTATGYDTFVGRMSISQQVNEVQPRPGFAGWKTYLEDDETIEEKVANDGFGTFYLSDAELSIELEANPHCIELSSEPFYMGRWSDIKHMTDFIRENGIPDKYYYSREDALYMLKNRKNLFEYTQKFGTSAMITFCGDKHMKWLDYFHCEKWSLERFIQWGKEELIYVDFQELIHFDFPEQQPDYYNVFIYDDFRDLK